MLHISLLIQGRKGAQAKGKAKTEAVTEEKLEETEAKVTTTRTGRSKANKPSAAAGSSTAEENTMEEKKNEVQQFQKLLKMPSPTILQVFSQIRPLKFVSRFSQSLPPDHKWSSP